MMSSIGERIQYARKQLGISQGEVAKRCGWSNRGRISLYEQGARLPNPNDLKRLAEVLGVSIEWIYGETTPTAKSLEDFLAHITKDLPNANEVINSTIFQHAKMLPVMTLEALQTAVEHQRPIVSNEHMMTLLKTSSKAFAMMHSGDSMEAAKGSSFPDGTIIVIDPEKPAQQGDFVLAYIRKTHSLTFKQLTEDAGKQYLKPLNPAYPTIELNQGIDLIGTGVVSMLEI